MWGVKIIWGGGGGREGVISVTTLSLFNLFRSSQHAEK